MKENIHTKIRAYIRANPHLNDDILADKFGVTERSISANRSHITMGTDTENPQARAKVVKRNLKSGLTLIKTQAYELMIDEDGQYIRLDLVSRIRSKITDDQAKAIMLTEMQN